VNEFEVEEGVPVGAPAIAEPRHIAAATRFMGIARSSFGGECRITTYKSSLHVVWTIGSLLEELLLLLSEDCEEKVMRTFCCTVCLHLL